MHLTQYKAYNFPHDLQYRRDAGCAQCVRCTTLNWINIGPKCKDGNPRLMACRIRRVFVAEARCAYISSGYSLRHSVLGYWMGQHGRYLKILGTSVLAGLCVFVVLFIIHLARKPCQLQIKASQEIERLSIENERLRRSLTQITPELAEEDPPVFLDPLNSEYIAHGYLPFRISNKGQRVNPATGITIQPIKELPSVAFEYIDRIDPNTEKIIAPTIDGDHFDCSQS